MSLADLDQTLLYAVGYICLALAASVLLSTVSARMAAAKSRKGQQHPMGWRNSIQS